MRLSKILVVEDRASDRNALGALLGASGYEILYATDGAQALEVAQTERPDLIITDLLMPTMDGYEFVRRLRADPAIAHTAVIFYSGVYSDERARRLAQAGGVRHILTKPTDPQLILSTVASALGQGPHLAPPLSPEKFSGDHLRLLTDKLHQKTGEVETLAPRLAALIEVGQQLASEYDSEQLLRRFVDAAREIIGAEYAMVGVLDDEGRALRHFLVSGPGSKPAPESSSGRALDPGSSPGQALIQGQALDAEAIPGIPPPSPRAGVLGILLAEQRPLRLHGSGAHPWAGSLPLHHPSPRSFLGVPILSPAWVYGWLCLCNRSDAEEFSEEDERLAEALAAQAAVAYENGRRYEEIQRQADELRHEMAELNQAKDVLGRQHRLIDAIFDNILAHVCYLDQDFCFMRVNATYAQSRGYTAEELIGRNYFVIFPDTEFRAIFERVRDTGEPYVARSHPMVCADRPDGDVTYWDWWLRPICSPEGGTEGLVLSLVDVTLVESSRRDVERLNADLREASSAKDRFLAELSHELRNPLAPILAGVEILRRTMPPEGPSQFTLEVVERNAKLQARLVNDLLDLSRITSGKLQLQRAPVALDAIVESAVQAIQKEAEKAEIFLLTDLQAGLWVYGDLDRLQQLIMNLLTNALKFTGAGGRVQVNAKGADGKGRIVVEDTGIGIASDLLPHLFERFRQGDVAGQRKPGLGIGLALVKSIAERHGGQVWAESAGPGKGSQFSVEFPLIAAPNRHAPVILYGEKCGQVRLLLLEDNPDTRILVASGLEMRGYTVQATGSAEDALEILKQARPDVILADIGLPGMDGYEFLRQARQMPGLTDIAAFAITGFGQEEDVRRAREVGYHGHFVKPVEIELLDRHIRQWLEASPEIILGQAEV